MHKPGSPRGRKPRDKQPIGYNEKTAVAERREAERLYKIIKARRERKEAGTKDPHLDAAAQREMLVLREGDQGQLYLYRERWLTMLLIEEMLDRKELFERSFSKFINEQAKRPAGMNDAFYAATILNMGRAFLEGVKAGANAMRFHGIAADDVERQKALDIAEKVGEELNHHLAQSVKNAKMGETQGSA